MVTNKHITKIVAVIMAVACVLCLVAVGCSDKLTEVFGDTGVKMSYESKLFDTEEVMSVNIIMDEEDWNTMLTNAGSEEYYVCDVVVNGTKFKNVGIRPKGNTSLSTILMDPDTNRYSFKHEFDHFVEGIVSHGLFSQVKVAVVALVK